MKGTRLRAATVWGDLVTNGLSLEEAAAEFDLPVAAVEEAVTWCEQNRELLRLEASEERRRMKAAGVGVGADAIG